MQFHPLNIPDIAPGLRLAVHESGDQNVSPAIRATGIWEAYETYLVTQLVASGNTVLDVGANIGYYTVLLSRLVGPKGRVLAFEPEPVNVELLTSNVVENKADNVDIMGVALGAEDSQARLFLSESNFGDHQVYSDGSNRPSLPIEIRHGDRLLKSQMIDSVDFIKIDTQGAEYGVLSGLSGVVKNSPKISMIVEFWPLGLRRSGASGLDLIDLIQPWGLDLAIVDHIDGNLVDCSYQQLREWTEMVDSHEGDEGFMNILVGRRP